MQNYVTLVFNFIKTFLLRAEEMNELIMSHRKVELQLKFGKILE